MQMSLNPDDLVVETAVIGPEPDQASADSQLWYTNTRPVEVSDTGCTSCWA